MTIQTGCWTDMLVRHLEMNQIMTGIFWLPNESGHFPILKSSHVTISLQKQWLWSKFISLSFTKTLIGAVRSVEKRKSKCLNNPQKEDGKSPWLKNIKKKNTPNKFFSLLSRVHRRWFAPAAKFRAAKPRWPTRWVAWDVKRGDAGKGCTVCIEKYQNSSQESRIMGMCPANIADKHDQHVKYHRTLFVEQSNNSIMCHLKIAAFWSAANPKKKSHFNRFCDNESLDMHLRHSK